MSHKKHKSFLLGITVISIVCNISLVWPQIQTWLIKIDERTELTTQDFEAAFHASIDFQGLQQPFLTDQELAEARQNGEIKKLFLENSINDLLIHKDLKSKGLIDEKALQARAQRISKILRSGLLKRLYIQKVHIPAAPEPDSQEIRAIYKEMQKDPQFKDIKATQLYKMAKKQAFFAQLERDYIERLRTLRSQYKINISEEYTEQF